MPVIDAMTTPFFFALYSRSIIEHVRRPESVRATVSGG